MALGELAKARRQLVVNMFGGTRRVFGRSGQISSAKSLISKGKSVKTSVSKLARGGSSAGKAVATLPGMKEAFENFIVESADVANTLASDCSRFLWAWTSRSVWLPRPHWI